MSRFRRTRRSSPLRRSLLGIVVTLPALALASGDAAGWSATPVEDGAWRGNGLAAAAHVLEPAWPASGPYGRFASRSPWRLPGRPDPLGGIQRVSYPVDAGYVRIVPQVIVPPNADADAPGLVALGVERAVASDPLRWKAQLGWSGAPDGSFEVDYRAVERTVVVRGEDRSLLAARLPGGRAAGTLIESRWTERLDARTSAVASLTSDRLALDSGLSASSAGVELRHRPQDHWTLLARLDAADYSGASAGHRRGTMTVGTGFDARGIGVTAAYRNEAASSGGGHGGRLSLRGATGGFAATGYADVQQGAGLIEVDLAHPTEWPRHLGELGLVGMRPEAAVQALRDRPGLLHDHGLQLGALRSDTLRVQGGFDLSWRRSPGAAEFGARVAYDGLDGAASARRALLGSLYTSWRLFGDAALTASYASWFMQDGIDGEQSRQLFRLSLRAPL